MTLQECTAVLAPFALALRADVDDPTFRAYHRVLKDVPAALFQAAVDAVALEPDIRFLPTAPELRGRCERTRHALLQAQPYEGCCDCEHGPGWQTVTDGNMQKVQRCPCWTRYLLKLARLGIGTSLSTARPSFRELESAQGPALDEVPPAVTDRVREIAASKRLR